MNVNIGKIKERLASLLAKTTENGASEAEAMAAMKVAESLAERYGVSLEDLAKPETASFEQRTVQNDLARSHEVDTILGNAISVYTGTRRWFTRGSKSKWDVVYFGLEADVELAVFLRSLLKATMISEWAFYRDFVWEQDGSENKARHSFMTGFCVRVAERLAEFTRAREAVGTGRELVVRKQEVVKAEMANRGIRLGNGGLGEGRRSGGDAAAYGAGGVAGANASLGRGVSGGVGLLT